MEESNEDVKNGSWKILKILVIQVSIDREFLSIGRMYFLIDWRGIENWSSQVEALWWNSSLSRSIKNSFRSIECWFWSIEQESRINQTRQNLCDEFLHFPIDWEKVRLIEGTEFWIFTCFLLSVKTLIKGKVMCDEITHGFIYND